MIRVASGNEFSKGSHSDLSGLVLPGPGHRFDKREMPRARFLSARPAGTNGHPVVDPLAASI